MRPSRGLARKRRSIGTVRRPSGSSSCGGRCPATCCTVRRPVRCTRVRRPTCPLFHACPVSGLRASGVRVCHVRVGPVSAVVVRGASWSRADRSWVGRERPARTAEHARAATTGAVWAPAGLAQESAGGRLVLAARSRLEAEGRALIPHGPVGLVYSSEECLASYQTLSWEWIGCGDYAQWSSREASGRAAWSLRAFPAGLRRELAAALRPQHAVSAARSKLTTP